MPEYLGISLNIARPNIPISSDPSVVYALVKLVPDAMTAASIEAAPCNVALVIDKSGSMYNEDRLKHVVRAACAGVEKLSERDILSAVAFSGKAQVFIEPTPVTDHARIQEAIRQIDSVRAGSGTCMDFGMASGVEVVRKNFSTDYLNRVLVLTDGETRHEDKCRSIAKQEAENGLSFSTFGVGSTWNEKLLMEIADCTGGNSHYIRNASDADTIFDDEFDQITSAKFTNVRLNLRVVRGVTVRRVSRIYPEISVLQPEAIDDKSYEVPFRAINDEELLLFDLLVDPKPAGSFRLGRLVAQYDVPSENLHAQKTSEVGVFVNYTSNMDALGHINPEVMGYVDQMNGHILQDKAQEAIEQGEMARATQLLQSAQGITQRLGNAKLTQRLTEALTELQATGALSDDTRKTITFASRKTTRLEAAG
ncbi:MAG: VWA domain-containing protein [Candidatus Poribacteria bacterium]|nr:VWA domain-containing protein [Candidatus Poribacteria bacterium]